MVAVSVLTDCDVLAPGTPGGRRALWAGQAYDLTPAQVEEAGANVRAEKPEQPEEPPKPKRRRRTRKQE